MNILLLGSGGRESAIAWKISQSKSSHTLYILPGNGGTLNYGENIEGNALDFDFIKKVVFEKGIHMVVVGPEDPLAHGIVDYFQAQPDCASIPVIGPTARGAMLEGSKDFAKQFMLRHNIPTARYFSVNAGNIETGIAFLKQLHPPYVLKADGLAAGKGVVIVPSLDQAVQELREMLSGKFGKASSTVVLEEFLKGIEVSYFVATDGKHFVLLPEAKDYKKIGEHDSGPNTGGMGAISPVPFATPEFTGKVMDRIIIPTIQGLQSENIVYKGFIFFGLINCLGNPYVIEYNARLGDPETEVVIPRLQSDIVELFEAIANENLLNFSVSISAQTAASVMLVSKGYPGTYEKGKIISQLDQVKGSVVFHAGTQKRDHQWITSGGRVMAITSLGKTIDEALTQCYKNSAVIQYEGKTFRYDIGFDLKNN